MNSTRGGGGPLYDANNLARVNSLNRPLGPMGDQEESKLGDSFEREQDERDHFSTLDRGVTYNPRRKAESPNKTREGPGKNRFGGKRGRIDMDEVLEQEAEEVEEDAGKNKKHKKVRNAVFSRKAKGGKVISAKQLVGQNIKQVLRMGTKIGGRR